MHEAADALMRNRFAIERIIRPEADSKMRPRLLRSAPAKVAAPKPAALPGFRGDTGFRLRSVGAPDRALDYPEREAQIGYLTCRNIVWRPLTRPVRKTERFKRSCATPALSITGARAAGRILPAGRR